MDEDAGPPANVSSSQGYRGVNHLLLTGLGLERGYTSRWWGTFNQWADLGGQVRRRPDHIPPGEWGCKVVFCREMTKTRATDDGEEDDTYRVLKSYSVFNLDQVDGPALDRLRNRPRRPDGIDYEPADRVIRATNADIRYGGDRAFYHRVGDFIQLPERHAFVSTPEWYATHFHELSHWAEKRVGWKGSYEMGELVAEIAACFLSTELSIPQGEDLSNHEAYLQSWVRHLENDHTQIFRAASTASRTSDFVLGFTRHPDAHRPHVIIV